MLDPGNPCKPARIRHGGDLVRSLLVMVTMWFNAVETWGMRMRLRASPKSPDFV